METPTLELNELKTRVDQLEQKLFQLEAKVALPDAVALTVSPQAPRTQNAGLRADLLARGVIRKPSPEELAVAARWQARPEKERARIVEVLQTLRLDPPLSEIIHRMRAGWYPGEEEQAGPQAA